MWQSNFQDKNWINILKLKLLYLVFLHHLIYTSKLQMFPKVVISDILLILPAT